MTELLEHSQPNPPVDTMGPERNMPGALYDRAKAYFGAIREHFRDRHGDNLGTAMAAEDQAVANLIEESHGVPGPTEADRLTTDIVGAEEIITTTEETGVGRAPETAEALSWVPPDELAEALGIIGNNEGGEDGTAVKTVCSAIDAAKDGDGAEEDKSPGLSEQRSSLGEDSLQEESRDETLAFIRRTSEYLESLPEDELRNKYASGDMETHDLFKQIANIPFPMGPKLHDTVLTVLRSQHGDVADWKGLEPGSSDITGLYMERPDFGRIIVRAAEIEYARSGGLHTGEELGLAQPPEGLGEANRTYVKRIREAAAVALEAYGADGTIDEGKMELIQTVFGSSGDFVAFGFDKQWEGSRKSDVSTQNHKAFEAADNYVQNIERIGADAAMQLHEQLGIANFQRYDSGMLENAVKLLQDDEDIVKRLQQNGIALLISGHDGDHNGAFANLREASRHALPFEVSSLADITGLIDVLKTRGIDIIKHLTLAGHGGERGLHLSDDCLMPKSAFKDTTSSEITTSPLNRLFRQLLKSGGDCTLNSCSQAKQYGGKSSLADQLAATYLGMKVIGANDVMHLSTEDRRGGVEVGSGDAWFLEKTRWGTIVDSLEAKGKQGRANILKKIAKLLHIDKYRSTAVSVVAYPSADRSRPLMCREKINQPVRIS